MPAGVGYPGKLPPGAPGLAPMLVGMSADDLPGSPQGPRVGPIPDRVGPPPVARYNMKRNAPSVTGRG